MKKAISFWENKSKNGNVYYTGKLGELDLVGFKNSKKKNEKEPDLIFYIREDRKKEETPKEEFVETDPFKEFGESIEINDNLLD